MLNDILEPNDRRLIYSPSEDFNFYLQQKLYEKYHTTGEYRIFVETETELKDVISKTVVPPLTGDYWSINIRYNPKKMNKKFIQHFLSFQSEYAFMTLWVKEYRDFMHLTSMPEIWKDSFLYVGKFGYLSKDDAKLFYADSIRYKEFEPPEPVVKYLIENYRFDIKSLAYTIGMINGGREINDTKELIQIAGLGNTTVDNLVIKLLTSSTKTKKGVEKLYAECIAFTDNLNTKLEYRTIINFMNKTLQILLDIKQLQLRGLYKNIDVPISPIYELDRMIRYNRYEKKLIHNISIVDILNLKTALQISYDRDDKIHLMKALSNYMDYLYSRGGGDKGEEERKQAAKRKREENKRKKEEQKAYIEAYKEEQKRLAK